MDCPKVDQAVLYRVKLMVGHFYFNPGPIEPACESNLLNLPVGVNDTQNSILPHFLFHWPFGEVFGVSIQVYADLHKRLIWEGELFLNIFNSSLHFGHRAAECLLFELVHRRVSISVNNLKAQKAGLNCLNLQGERDITFKTVFQLNFSMVVLSFCPVFVSSNRESFKLVDMVLMLNIKFCTF